MNNNLPPDETFSSRSLLSMSVASFVFYLVSSILIIQYFHEDDLAALFEHGYSFTTQISVGGLAGCIAAGIIIFLAGKPPLSKVLDDFYLFRVITRIRFTPFDRIQVSFFAGIGEEVLFRGAIQPLLGIWITSLIFIGIHGYFKFSSAGHMLFGFLMFGLSVLLGFMFEYAGLVAAMSCHAIYDLLMLWWAGKHNAPQLFLVTGNNIFRKH